MRLRSNGRIGLTPIVSIVLLLLMVVALAGALFAWYTDIQDESQRQFEDEFQSTLLARGGPQCNVNTGGNDEIVLELRNAGKDLNGQRVDLYVYDANQSIYMLMEGMNWESAGYCTSRCRFLDAGDFDSVTIPTPSGTDFVDDAFYTVSVEFTSDNAQVDVGGCIAG